MTRRLSRSDCRARSSLSGWNCVCSSSFHSASIGVPATAAHKGSTTRARNAGMTATSLQASRLSLEVRVCLAVAPGVDHVRTRAFVRDHLPGHAYHHPRIRHGVHDHAVGADSDVVAKTDSSEHLRTRTQVDAVPDSRGSWRLPAVSHADGDALVDVAVLAHGGLGRHDDLPEVADVQTRAAGVLYGMTIPGLEAVVLQDPAGTHVEGQCERPAALQVSRRPHPQRILEAGQSAICRQNAASDRSPQYRCRSRPTCSRYAAREIVIQPLGPSAASTPAPVCSQPGQDKRARMSSRTLRAVRTRPVERRRVLRPVVPRPDHACVRLGTAKNSGRNDLRMARRNRDSMRSAECNRSSVLRDIWPAWPTRYRMSGSSTTWNS